MITQNYLHELFDYKDGNLYWKIKKSKNTKIGAIVCTQVQKRICVRIDGVRYFAHRIIFLMFNGYLPNEIDHIDGNPLNNKIENLRECNSSQNKYNIKLRTDNKSGIKNVRWREDRKKWEVRLWVDGKRKYFGQYFDKNVAKFVSDTMRYKYHKEFANHG
jgi:hypothetical protein